MVKKVSTNENIIQYYFQIHQLQIYLQILNSNLVVYLKYEFIIEFEILIYRRRFEI